MRNPDFVELVESMLSIHEKKSHDYAADNNVYSNFEYAAQVAAPFKDPVHKVFATMLGIKLARLAELLSSNKKPKNESVKDTFIDGPTYFAIFGAYVNSKLAGVKNARGVRSRRRESERKTDDRVGVPRRRGGGRKAS